ncbi:MAG: metallophosphoesterase [Thermodesulfovibrionales bacterium]|nr:metallophosphoesterase [Thermodesulfovibrionales bacterium]
MQRQNLIRKIILITVLLFLSASISSAVSDKPFAHLNTAALAQHSGGEFTFAVFGDFRPSRRDRPYSEAFLKMFDEINMISPSFILSMGDAYYGYGGSFQRFKNEIDYFLSRIKSLDTPFFNVIGNHEVGGSLERENYIKERFGNLYGSFDYANSHFILLDTDEAGKEGTIQGEQLMWLEKDIEANKNAENIFVLMHRPLFSALDGEMNKGKSFRDKSNRDNLHRLFKKYGVRAVFAGHEHLFNETVKDGIKYFITGGGGSPLYESPSKGGFLHYLIVSVKNKDIVIDVITPFNLHVRNISGNDGFEQRAEVEISNTSHAEIYIRNLVMKMPRAEAGKYKVKAISISTRGQTKEHQAKINRVKDNGDGTATVSIETRLQKNELVRIVLETEI